MNVTVLVEPTEEPVTLAEAKVQARVDGTDEDGKIADDIRTAREDAENATRRSAVTQTLRLTVDRWPSVDHWASVDRHPSYAHAYVLELPRPPLREVLSVEYVASDGALTTMDPADYEVDAGALVPTIRPTYGTHWPSLRCEPGAVRVTYVAGYAGPAEYAAAEAANVDPLPPRVPSRLRSAILLMVEDLFTHRGRAKDSRAAPNPTADRLLASLRIPGSA